MEASRVGFKGRACNGCFAFSCGHKSLMHACPDPSADDDCDKIEQACSGMGRQQCRSYLSGMSARGRQSMVECLTKSCAKGFGDMPSSLQLRATRAARLDLARGACSG